MSTRSRTVATVFSTFGTVLLATGFVMLAVAVTMIDVTASDANIGAGILVVVGTPVGIAGLLGIIVGVLARLNARPSRTSP